MHAVCFGVGFPFASALIIDEQNSALAGFVAMIWASAAIFSVFVILFPLLRWSV
jgi:hypothetical protein